MHVRALVESLMIWRLLLLLFLVLDYNMQNSNELLMRVLIVRKHFFGTKVFVDCISNESKSYSVLNLVYCSFCHYALRWSQSKINWMDLIDYSWSFYFEHHWNKILIKTILSIVLENVVNKDQFHRLSWLTDLFS